MLLGLKEAGAKGYQLAVVRREDPLYLTWERPLDTLFLVDYPSLPLPTGPLVGKPDCALLAYQSVLQGSMLDGELRWTAGQSPDPTIDDAIFGADLARCTGGCWSWTPEVSYDALNDDPQFLVSHGERALIGSTEGGLIRVEPSGVMSEVCAGVEGLRETVSAGAWAGEDEVWLGYTSGRISRLSLAAQRPGSPCSSQTATIAPERRPVQALAVSPPDEPFELFTLSSTLAGPATLRRWADSRFQQVLVAPDSHPVIAHIARMSPGNAVAAINLPELLIMGPDSARILPLNVDLTGVNGADAESVISDGHGDAWVGLSHLGPFRFELPERLDIRRRDPAIRNVRSMARFKDRTFYLDRRGVLGQFPDRGPDCPTAVIRKATAEGASFTEAFAIAPLGEDRLVIQASDDNSVTQLLRRQHLVLRLLPP